MRIKPFRAADDFYVYSAWNNTINRISRRLYDYLTNGADQRSDRELRRVMVALGLLPDRAVPVQIFTDKIICNALAQLRREGPARLVMTITESCNFRCRYCVFSGMYPHARPHGSRNMSLRTAFKALHWYFSFHRRHYGIGFYGGEPLQQRGLVERVVGEARKMAPPDAQLSFSMTTNGWCLDDAAIRFLVANAFNLFISLDGPARVHDRYRRTVGGRPTHARVWDRVRRIRELDPDYFARRVNFLLMLAPPVRVAEIVEFFKKNDDILGEKNPLVLTLEDAPLALYEDLRTDSDAYRRDLTRLRQRYLLQLACGKKPDGLSRSANESAMSKLARRRMTAPSPLVISGGQCVPGARCHVTPDGMLHACERVDLHFPIGHVDAGYDEQKIRALVKRYAELVRAQCLDCWAIRLCRKCLVDIAQGPLLSPARLSAVCAERRLKLERDLIDYCRARSGNDHCFDDLAAAQNDEDNPLI